MPSDHDADDERPGARGPLPPEDRLWRHPSEVGNGGAGSKAYGSGSLPTPWNALPAMVGGGAPAVPRRRPSGTAVAMVCLAGAVIALGVALAASPSKVVERRFEATPAKPAGPAAPGAQEAFPAEQVAAKVSPSVARLDVEGPAGWLLGSAVLLHADGTLVTTADLVRKAKRLIVTFDDGRPRTGLLVATDAQTDLAVLTVPVENRPAAVPAGGRPVVGQPTAMVGGPGPASRAGTVTTGVVRALGRQLDGPEGPLHDMIEIDRRVLGDTAGGALVDGTGAALGICMQGADGEVGYAVPIDVAIRVADALRKDGKVRWGWLGVQASNLDPGAARDLDIPGGAVIQTVEAGSPALAAGLRKGDVVMRLEPDEVRSVGDLVTALRTHKPDEQVQLSILREGRPVVVSTKLATR